MKKYQALSDSLFFRVLALVLVPFLAIFFEMPFIHAYAGTSLSLDDSHVLKSSISQETKHLTTEQTSSCHGEMRKNPVSTPSFSNQKEPRSADHCLRTSLETGISSMRSEVPTIPPFSGLLFVLEKQLILWMTLENIASRQILREEPPPENRNSAFVKENRRRI